MAELVAVSMDLSRFAASRADAWRGGLVLVGIDRGAQLGHGGAEGCDESSYGLPSGLGSRVLDCLEGAHGDFRGVRQILLRNPVCAA